MKRRLIALIIAILLQPLTSRALANCNLKVATAAGQYIAALEKAGLTKYQNSSVCEVLDYEFWSCSKSQKFTLEKSFKVKEVLGNYCQPHLRSSTPLSGNELMKGAELFSWKDHNGYLWYALLPGTNRIKTTRELIENKITSGYLRETILNLPPGTEVSWNPLTAVEDRKNLEFSIPAEAASDIKARAAQAKIKLVVQ